MVELKQILLAYIISQVVISYICFLIRNVIGFKDDFDWKACLVCLLFSFIPGIPALMLTINIIKNYRYHKKEKTKVIIKEINIDNNEDLEKQLKEIFDEIKKSEDK